KQELRIIQSGLTNTNSPGTIERIVKQAFECQLQDGRYFLTVLVFLRRGQLRASGDSDRNIHEQNGGAR
ncbi:MAG TPA: hypothetical protein VME24_04215, partial [Alphaproteobacteria bacterium]|nr:hypothetical protein [Alphaproteobacteria bacterium]